MNKKIFLISDTHFNHTNIIKYTNRPFKDEVKMNLTIFENWNSVVGNNDIVIHLGDLLLGNGEKNGVRDLIKNLKGKKHLIKGNHDKKKNTFYKNLGFEIIADFLIKEICGKKLLFIHQPLEGFNPENSFFDFVIHGHTHKKNPPEWENHINLSLELWNYTPVNLDFILNKYEIC
jgi:calcineurin-like phosphoesterase family protein